MQTVGSMLEATMKKLPHKGIGLVRTFRSTCLGLRCGECTSTNRCGGKLWWINSVTRGVSTTSCLEVHRSRMGRFRKDGREVNIDERKPDSDSRGSSAERRHMVFHEFSIGCVADWDAEKTKQFLQRDSVGKKWKTAKHKVDIIPTQRDTVHDRGLRKRLGMGQDGESPNYVQHSNSFHGPSSVNYSSWNEPPKQRESKAVSNRVAQSAESSRLMARVTQLKAQSNASSPLARLQPSDIAVVENQTIGTVLERVLPPEEDSHQAIVMYKQIVEMEPQTLLDHIQLNHEKMNKIHYALALKTLHRFGESLDAQEYQQYHAHVTAHPGFKVLLSLLALHAEYYKAGVSADMLCFISTFGFDSDEPAIQVYLQLAKVFVNDLTLDRLVQVSASLASMTPTVQTEALLSGLKILAWLRANDQNLETLSPDEVVHMFNLFFTILTDVQRDKLFSLLREQIDTLDPMYSILVLDGLRKASRELNIKSDAFMRQCIKPLKTLLITSRLNLEETKAALEACAELEIQDPKLLGGLVQTLMETAKQASPSSKLEILHSLRQGSLLDTTLVEFLVPGVRDHVLKMTEDDQVNFLKVCGDIDWSVVDDSLRVKTLETCRRIYNTFTGELEEQHSVDLLVMETLCEVDESESVLGNRRIACKLLEIRVRCVELDDHLKQLLPSALDKSMWSTVVRCYVHLDDVHVRLPFLLCRPGEKVGKFVLFPAAKRLYHKCNGQLLGTARAKIKILQDKGFQVCLLNYADMTANANPGEYLRQTLVSSVAAINGMGTPSSGGEKTPKCL